MSKTLNIPKDIIGSIVQQFKTYDTAANLPGWGRKWTFRQETWTISSGQDLKDDLMKAGTDVTVPTIGRLNNLGLN